MNWRPGIPLGDTADGYETYEIYDELCTPDGHVVATLACFVWNPTVYYCNALTPAGKWMRSTPAIAPMPQRETGPSVSPV